MLTIAPAQSPADIETIRRLFREYAESLHFNLCFQSFDKELAALPGEYAPPEGRLLLARWNDDPAGCVALHKFEDGICEMKRLYVSPLYRGKSIGRALACRIIEEARSIGYRAMRLDTIDTMTEAIALYKSLGFRRTTPYRHNPIEGAVYMELALKPPAAFYR